MTFHNRIGWAQDTLKRAALSQTAGRGLWLLTDAGRDYAARYPKGLPEDVVQALLANRTQVRLRAVEDEAELPKRPTLAAQELATRTPMDLIDTGTAAIRESVKAEILAHIAENSPEFFERLVLELLFALGYGESRQALEHSGKSGDGGIDGVISLDRLGLQKVYVQAKRWKSQVGSPEVQTFMGALQLRGADRGVLITSGNISQPAREISKHARGSVVLVDGDRLAELMIDNGVGVTNRPISIPSLDSDFFEDG